MSEGAWERLVQDESGEAGARPGSMFSAPCLKVGSKVYATYLDEAVVFKLPRDRVEALVADGAGAPFQPMGRTMKEWVSVADAERWPALAAEARSFVAGS